MAKLDSNDLPTIKNIFMPKVGLITILKVNNYGAELQAYALHKKLLDSGIDNEIIDYLYYTHPEHIRTKKSRRKFKVSLKDKLKWEAHKLKFFIDKLRKKESIKAKKIAAFHAKHTQFSPTYKTIKDLYEAKHQYEALIVGSDQVWNPVTHTSIEPYFLTFASKGVKKISYASSFGVSSIEEHNKPLFRQLLSNLDFLSCREAVGTEMIKALTGREAAHVLDPTLLLNAEEWAVLAIPPAEEKNYLLIYVLRASPFLKELAEHIVNRLGLTIINMGAPISGLSAQAAGDAGIEEFLGLIKNAQYVITDSFHGTIFSIIFQKQFLTSIPNRKKNNSRQLGLLEMLGIRNRALTDDDDYAAVEKEIIDFDSVHRIIDQERKKSLNYLKNALS